MAKRKIGVGRWFTTIMVLFLILLTTSGLISCYFAYESRREDLTAQLDNSLDSISQEFSDITHNYWQVYMPLFEHTSTVKTSIHKYFDTSAPLTFNEYNELSEALSQLRVRDSRIDWVGIYSADRSVNYILSNGKTSAEALGDSNFPCIDEISAENSGTLIVPDRNGNSFVIIGNIPSNYGNGKLLAAYSLNRIRQISNTDGMSIKDIRFGLSVDGTLIYDSAPDTSSYSPNAGFTGVVDTSDGRMYIKSIMSGINTGFAFYQIPAIKLLSYCHKYTPFIIGISFLFAGISLLAQALIGRRMTNELAVIRGGLDRIADNELSYRIPTRFSMAGLTEIAQNINDMSSRLETNISKAYYFELKQREASLAELQASFNPHFLYNTLEMLMSKSYSNGDTETAELISMLSSLFRGFIGSKSFVTLKEELALCNRYFTLLRARYADSVDVSYDIESELLDFGIIRNVFQLLIENYFVHGFKSESSEGQIMLSGHSDGDFIVFKFDDNGIGMSQSDIDALNQRINESIQPGEKSYGLKNLNQRLKLFYGNECGLYVSPSVLGGLCVTIRVMKMTVEDYEKMRKDLHLTEEATGLYTS